MVDKIDVDRNGVSKSALRGAAEDQLGKSTGYRRNLEVKPQKRSFTNSRSLILSWRCKMRN